MAIADGEQAVKWDPPAYEQRHLDIKTVHVIQEGGCCTCVDRESTVVTRFIGTDPSRNWSVRMCDECLQELVNWYNTHEK